MFRCHFISRSVNQHARLCGRFTLIRQSVFIIISKLGFMGERVKHLFLPSRNGPSKGQHSSDGISFMDEGSVCARVIKSDS